MPLSAATAPVSSNLRNLWIVLFIVGAVVR